MVEIAVPKCGESEKRNTEYAMNYTPEKFFRRIIKTNTPVILDVGAHHGESVIFFKNIFAAAEIHSFEPHPDNFVKLSATAERYQTNAINVAVGIKQGDVTFYKQRHSHLGGLKPINTESTDSLGYALKATNEAITVPGKTLDRLVLELQIEHTHILKIDVQGFEVSVLEGAQQALQSVEMLMIEISLFDFYGNSKNSWFDVNRILDAHNFELYDVAKVSKNPKNLRTDWVELIFIKKC